MTSRQPVGLGAHHRARRGRPRAPSRRRRRAPRRTRGRPSTACAVRATPTGGTPLSRLARRQCGVSAFSASATATTSGGPSVGTVTAVAGSEAAGGGAVWVSGAASRRASHAARASATSEPRPSARTRGADGRCRASSALATSAASTRAPRRSRGAPRRGRVPSAPRSSRGSRRPGAGRPPPASARTGLGDADDGDVADGPAGHPRHPVDPVGRRATRGGRARRSAWRARAARTASSRAPREGDDDGQHPTPASTAVTTRRAPPGAHGRSDLDGPSAPFARA